MSGVSRLAGNANTVGGGSDIELEDLPGEHSGLLNGVSVWKVWSVKCKALSSSLVDCNFPKDSIPPLCSQALSLSPYSGKYLLPACLFPVDSSHETFAGK